MGDAADDLMHHEIDLETGLAKLDSEQFELLMSRRIAEMVHELLRREIEPSHHPFYSKERQEETYFKHRNSTGEIIDVRDVNAEYAKNLYNWYLNGCGYDADILFMRKLREIFQEETK